MVAVAEPACDAGIDDPALALCAGAAAGADDVGADALAAGVDWPKIFDIRVLKSFMCVLFGCASSVDALPGRFTQNASCAR